MPSLAEKIRKSREFQREINGWKLRLRRPSDEEAGTLLDGRTVHYVEIARKFVVGWEDVKEADLLPSGGDIPASFSPEAWGEIIPDHPEMWKPIATEVIEAWHRSREQRQDAEKK